MGTSQKVVDRETFIREALTARRKGERVVFTNGCFDLLHVGHLRYLEAAREKGDRLIVGVNSDSSVRGLKGEGRPLVCEAERQEMLAGLVCVDQVTCFGEETPYDLIQACRPHFLVKGADWAGNVVGADLVEADGGRVELIRLIEGRSTTDLIRVAAQTALREGLVEA
jgi:D-beta-D-heptose 7-phosphate kinase/D-beta-D-heptose 1-phosphate adenosyltransferase